MQCSVPNRPVTVRDGGGLSKTAGNGEGRQGTEGDGRARVMSHGVKRIRLEVYDLNLVSTGGPSARTIVPYLYSSTGVAQ